MWIGLELVLGSMTWNIYHTCICTVNHVVCSCCYSYCMNTSDQLGHCIWHSYLKARTGTEYRRGKIIVLCVRHSYTPLRVNQLSEMISLCRQMRSQQCSNSPTDMLKSVWKLQLWNQIMKFSPPLPSRENRIKPESQVSSFSSSQTSGPARFTSMLFFSVNSFSSEIPVSSDSRIDMMPLFVILASQITKSFHVSAPAYELGSEHIPF